MGSIQNFYDFLALVPKANRIFNMPIDWENKYDLIFSDDISKKIFATGVGLDYADPDLDYEDDVRAFITAINERASKLQFLLDS